MHRSRSHALLWISLLVAGLFGAAHARAQTPDVELTPAPVAPSDSPPIEAPAPAVEPSTALAPAPEPAAQPAPVVAAPPEPPEVVVAPADVAQAGESGPRFTAGAQGFTLSGEGTSPAYVLKLQAVLQTDGRVFLDHADNSKTTVLVRRARPALSGTLLDLVDFALVPDFSGSQAVLFDGYLDIHPFPWLRLRTGKFKAPLGLERLQSDTAPEQSFIERALTSNLASQRDVGAQLWGEIADGVLLYAFDVLDGAPDNVNLDLDSDKYKDLAGRIFLRPFQANGLSELGNLGIGVAGSTGERGGSAKTPLLGSFRTVGQNVFFGYRAPATDAMGTLTVYATGRQNRLNPQLYYYYGPFGLLGEAIWSQQHLRIGNNTAQLTHRAWHGAVSYVIGGKAGYNGATPNAPWDPSAGQLGALEIAARYEWIEIDSAAFPTFADPAASARRAQGPGVSVAWILARPFRVMAELEHTSFEGASATTGKHRPSENVLLMRAQVAF